jgi:hypothetical protein
MADTRMVIIFRDTTNTKEIVDRLTKIRASIEQGNLSLTHDEFAYSITLTEAK